MAASTEHIIAQIQRWTSSRLADSSDAVLLDRFVHGRNEAAFAALVTRHGAMVLRSCRRVLGDAQEAEDAFQATFLILARKAHTLRQSEALPGFLHSVARRVALKARGRSAARFSQMPLPETLSDPRSDPLARLTARELLMVLDEEVQRLPAAQRSAVVLCCLEGHPQEEAARMLGCTAGSLKGHLERGRKRLHARLTRRGIALSAALAIVAVSRGEAVSALLRQSAVRAALGGAGRSPLAAALAASVLKGPFVAKFACVTALVLTVALSASAIALVYRTPAGETPDDKPSAALAAPKKADASKPEKRVDALGDPLPAGAIARLGTVRFRHAVQITFAAFTPDGKRLVSRGIDGVRVWDAATGKQLRYFAPEPGNYWGATDLSPDGKTLAVASESYNGHIDFWDISSGKKTSSLGRGFYTRVRLSPNGKLLAAYSANAEFAVVELWDVVTQRKLRAWNAHGRAQVTSLLFSADSRKLLTSSLDDKVRLWDTENGKQLQEFTRRGRRWYDSSFDEAISPDGKLVALFEKNEKSKSRAGAIEWKALISLRDTATGKQVRLLICPSQKDFSGQAHVFSAMTFTPDGKKLLTGGPDRFLRVWDWATGDELQRWPLEVGCPYPLTLSRDGKTLAAVMRQGRAIQLLDMASGKPRQSLTGHLADVWFSVLTPDCRSALTVDAEGTMFLWDAAASRIRRVLKGHDGPIFSLQLAPDGRTLYTLGWDKTVRVWDLSNGEERRRISLGQEFMPYGYGALALSPDGGTLAVLGSTKTNRLLDTTSGRELRRFEGPERIKGAAFAADGRSLVVWSGDLKVRIWDAMTGRLLRTYPLPNELRSEGDMASAFGLLGSYNAAVSPDGRLLAVCRFTEGLDKSKYFIILKDLATGRDVHRLDNLPADRLAFSPDGRVLAWSGTKDGSIHLVETASGGERRRLPGHSGGKIDKLAFSADGTRLISSGSDTTALIWDIGDLAKHHRATAAELQALWTDLAGGDAARAYQAIRQLAASPTAAVPFLRKHLSPVPPVDEKRLARLIADLDSDDFAARQKATKEMEQLGKQAVPAYRKALESNPTPEARRRLDDLLEKAEAELAWWDVSGERLRSLRAVEALELAGTKEARELLKNLAAGVKGARLTEEAKAALQRLAKPARN